MKNAEVCLARLNGEKFKNPETGVVVVWPFFDREWIEDFEKEYAEMGAVGLAGHYRLGVDNVKNLHRRASLALGTRGGNTGRLYSKHA